MNFSLIRICCAFLLVASCSSSVEPPISELGELKPPTRLVAQVSYTYVCGVYRRWYKPDERKAGTYELWGSEESLQTPNGEDEFSTITFESDRESIQVLLTRDGRFKVLGRANPSEEIQFLGEYRGAVQVNGYYQAIMMAFEIPGISSDTYQIQCN
jgi:hypothetical protein